MKILTFISLSGLIDPFNETLEIFEAEFKDSNLNAERETLREHWTTQ
jgi:hypothetical protein